MTTTLLCGSSKEILKTLDKNSVQCVITSPPYFNLRDYNIEGQIGMEQSCSEYIDRLVDTFREVRRVLKDDGTVWLVIGDSYFGSSQTGGQKSKEGSSKRVGRMFSNTSKPSCFNCKPKDRMMVPARVAIALQDDGWYLRDEIVWEKPNAMPSSVKDRTTSSHEMLYLLTKKPKYYYNSVAIREPCVDGDPSSPRDSKGVVGQMNSGRRGDKQSEVGNRTYTGFNDGWRVRKEKLEFRNKRSVWTINTAPFTAKKLGFETVDHYAAFPSNLVEPCILAGSREGDIVLDIFCGSGTVGVVADKYSRDFIGIDLNPDYIDIAKKRIETGCQ